VSTQNIELADGTPAQSWEHIISRRVWLGRESVIGGSVPGETLIYLGRSVSGRLASAV
jgi:hypothetical protein